MKDNKKSIALSIIVVALFVVCVIATSYAFYSSTTKTEGKGTSANTTTQKISATFTDGSELNIDNMVPGDTFTKTVTLQNTGSTTIKYKISIKDVENNFTNQDDIKISVKKGSSDVTQGSATEMNFPATAASLTDELTLAVSATDTFTITIEYKNTSSDQSVDIGHKVGGTLYIEEV